MCTGSNRVNILPPRNCKRSLVQATALGYKCCAEPPTTLLPAGRHPCCGLLGRPLCRLGRPLASLGWGPPIPHCRKNAIDSTILHHYSPLHLKSVTQLSTTTEPIATTIQHNPPLHNHYPPLYCHYPPLHSHYPTQKQRKTTFAVETLVFPNLVAESCWIVAV